MIRIALTVILATIASSALADTSQFPASMRGLSGHELTAALDKYHGVKGLKLQRSKGARVACAPFANGDGTQVLATFAASADECGLWATTNLVRLVDFKEQVLCGYMGGECTPHQELDEEGQAYVDGLQKHFKPLTEGGCEPTTDWESFLIETVPAGNGYGCGASVSVVRAYDLYTKKVVFLDGKGKKVGWIPLSRDRFIAVMDEARARWGHLAQK